MNAVTKSSHGMSVPAVHLEGVSKSFVLHRTAIAGTLSAIGIHRFARRTGKGETEIKRALREIDLVIARGERVGVIGRNGSGKTTLLRLVIGDTLPSAGAVRVQGSVQAMMPGGYGFADELSGLDNVRNSFLFNGLERKDWDAAIEDIVEFVELGEFLMHPVKTYSLGMRARLEFATVTAVHPDILAIDEVLGAGDGYFVQKSVTRMKSLIEEGTLLLVSHDLHQILGFCERAIWLDDGRIVRDGPAEDVVKAYQHFMAKEEAAIHEQIRASTNAMPEGKDSLVVKQGTVRAKSREALAPLTESEDVYNRPRLGEIGFGESRDSMVALETGQELDLRFSSDGLSAVHDDLVPVVYVFTEHGAMRFEAAAGTISPPVDGDRLSVRLRADRLGIGVGNYFLTVALRSAATGQLVAVEHGALVLRMLATNWSEPPGIHLKGTWTGGESSDPMVTRISAWV